MIFYTITRTDLTNALSALFLLEDIVKYEYVHMKPSSIHVVLLLKIDRELTEQELNLLEAYGSLNGTNEKLSINS